MDEKFLKLNEEVINIYFDDSVKITKDFMSALDPESLKNVDRATMISFRIIVKFLHEYENLKSKDSDVNKSMKYFIIACNKAIIDSKSYIPELVKLFQGKMQNKMMPMPEFEPKIQKGDENVF